MKPIKLVKMIKDNMLMFAHELEYIKYVWKKSQDNHATLDDYDKAILEGYKMAYNKEDLADLWKEISDRQQVGINSLYKLVEEQEKKIERLKKDKKKLKEDKDKRAYTKEEIETIVKDKLKETDYVDSFLKYVDELISNKNTPVYLITIGFGPCTQEKVHNVLLSIKNVMDSKNIDAIYLPVSCEEFNNGVQDISVGRIVLT